MGLLKSIKKTVKNIFSGIGKLFRKVTDSKIGKALLIGAAIFVGGAMLGAWQGPAWLSGGAGTNAAAATAGEATALAAPTTGSLASSTAAAEAGAVAAAGEGGLAATAGLETAAAAAPEAVVTSNLPAATQGGGLVSQAAGGGAASGGAITAQQAKTFEALVSAGVEKSAALKAAGMEGLVALAPAKTGLAAFAQNHPFLAYGGMMAGGQVLAGAMQPDPYEEYVKQQRYDRMNSNYAGVYGDGRTYDIRMPTAGLVSQVNGSRGRA